MKDNDRIRVRAKVTVRGWAIWAAAAIIMLLLNGIVWTPARAGSAYPTSTAGSLVAPLLD